MLFRSVVLDNLGECSALTTDNAGNIYAALSSANSILKISPAGISTIIASAKNPSGIAVDTAGTVYFSELNYNRIRKVSPSGVVSTLAGREYSIAGYANGTGANALFNAPFGLAINSSGDIFVADSGNNRIRKITPAGVVSTFAGNGVGGLVNGPAASASFSKPREVVADPYGNLYVGEIQYNQLKDNFDPNFRKISADGLVSTLSNIGGSYPNSSGNGPLFLNNKGLAYFENKIKNEPLI